MLSPLLKFPRVLSTSKAVFKFFYFGKKKSKLSHKIRYINEASVEAETSLMLFRFKSVTSLLHSIYNPLQLGSSIKLICEEVGWGILACDLVVILPSFDCVCVGKLYVINYFFTQNRLHILFEGVGWGVMLVNVERRCAFRTGLSQRKAWIRGDPFI